MRLAQDDLVQQIAGYAGISADEARQFLKTLSQVVEQGLAEDGEVRLRNLGAFRLKEAAAHAYQHPRTGERLEAPAVPRVLFRPHKAVASLVNFRHSHLATRQGAVVQPARRVGPAAAAVLALVVLGVEEQRRDGGPV